MEVISIIISALALVVSVISFVKSKARFKRAYINEIKNWVESNDVKDKYVMPQSKFHATVKVYNEWYNLEQ